MRKRACMAIIGIMMLIPATTYVQEVFTSGGGYFIHGSYSFSTTLGEPITETFTLPGKFFTQGMQQPHTRDCVNPLDGGRIGNPQVRCGDFDPAPLGNIQLPRHYFGALEYLWVYSTLGETGPFDTLTLARDTIYDPPLLSQTTWFKRLSRARCMPDWSKAAESNVVMITVHPLPTVALNLVQDELCEGSAGLLLAGGTPAGGSYTGTYIISGSFYAAFSGPGSFPVTYTYKDMLGCEAQAVHHITVLPLPVVSHPALSVCVDAPTLVLSGGNPAGGTYSGSHVSSGVFQVATAGVGTHTINYAYKGANGCTRIVPLTVSVHPLPVVTHAPLPYVCENHGLVSLGGGEPAGGTYSGSHVSGGSFDPAAAGPGLHSITYTYRDATTQCVQTMTLSVEVKPLPQVSVSADTAICLGACATLSASGGHSYLWSTGSTTPVVTLCPATSRNFHITISNSDGCAVAKTIHVEVLPLPLPVVTSDTICQGESAMLVVSGGVSYAWDNGLTSPSIQVSPLQTSQYSVTVTAANGCKATASGVVMVNPLPPADAGANQSICKGDCTILTASGGVSYSWSGGGGLPMIEVCPTSSTTYTVTVTASNGCSASDQVYVEVRVVPLASAGAVQYICEGLGATLTATGGLSYAWSSGDITPSISVTPLITTPYQVTVTGANGCSATAGVQVIVWPAPQVQTNSDTILQAGGTATLTAQVNAGLPPYTALWTPGPYLSQPNSLQTMANPISPTLYQILVTDARGCTAMNQVAVGIDWDDNAVFGQVFYANSLQTPLTGVTVKAESILKAAATTLSDAHGNFLLQGLSDGSHYITGMSDTDPAYGIVNSTDAMLAMMHFVGLAPLEGIHLKAADVGNDGAVNTTDALQIAQYFVNAIPGFDAGSWVFEQDEIILAGDTILEHNVAGLYVGDINASFNPGMKAGNSLYLLQVGELFADGEGRVHIPISVDQVVSLGAMSLVIHLPQGLVVHEVKSSEGLLEFAQQQAQLRIAWANPTGRHARAGEEILWLTASLRTDFQARPWTLGEQSELADPDGGKLEQIGLNYPAIMMDQAAIGLSAWPNPGRTLIDLHFNIPEAAPVLLEVYDQQGRLVSTLMEGILDEGSHRVSVNVSEWPAAVYHCRLAYLPESGPVVRNLKIVVMP